MAKQAPGPKGLPVIGHYLELRRNILELMLSSRERYGDVVRFTLGPRVLHVISDPDLIRHVLVANRANYAKTARSSQQIKYLAGLSLLVSNDADWQVKRRLLQPAFKINTVTAYFELMQELAEASCASTAEAQIVDMSSLIMHLTYRVVGLALLSNDQLATGEDVEQAMTLTLKYLYNRINNPSPPFWIPTPSSLIFRRERRRLRRIVSDILRRRSNSSEVGDLLSEMIAAKNSERDSRLNETWLRDEVVTLLLAGHETTANALSFCLYLLARYPQVQQRVYDEICQVTAGHRLQVSGLEKLTYTHQVLRESLRMYPPIWAMERFVKQADELAGFSIPGGSTLFISIYALHRHSGFWSHPDSFNPDRFADKGEQRAYMPFGLGPRMCLGMNFAMQEAIIILVTLLQHFELANILEDEIVPQAGITLRVQGKLPMQLKPR